MGKNSIFVIDNPWIDDPAKRLDAWIFITFNHKSDMIIPTRFHSDDLGEPKDVRRTEADSIALDKTVALCRKFNLPIPKQIFVSLDIIENGSFSLELFHPGEGHSPTIL